MKNFIKISLMAYALLLFSTVAQAQTTRYTQNFDALTVGTVPTGWTNVSGGTWAVGTTTPVSGANSFGETAGADGHYAVYTALTAQADMTVQWVETAQTNAFQGVQLRSSNDAATGYLINLNLTNGGLFIVPKSSGSFGTVVANTTISSFAAGTRVIEKAEVQGTALRFKVWAYGTAEPGSWTWTGTDSTITAAGTFALRMGVTGTVTTYPTIDDLFAGDAGSSWAEGPVPVVISVTNSSLCFAPYVTFSDGVGAMQANNAKLGSTYVSWTRPGSYLKTVFSGTSCYLNVDVTPLSSAGISAGDYPNLRWSVDGAAYQNAQLATGQTSVTLKTGAAAGTHTLYLVLVSSNASGTTDRWNTPANVVKITGLTLDNGASVSVPTLLSSNSLFYMDSIGEGINVSSGVNDATLSAIPAVAAALGSEYGAVVAGGAGFTIGVQGNIPPLFTPGNAAGSSWDKYFVGQSRLISGLFSPQPTNIIEVLATNDFNYTGQTFNGYTANINNVAASLQGWLTAVRAAAPTAKIYVVVPFGQFASAQVTAGFTAYQTAAPDANALLINLGTILAAGISGPSGTATQFSADGIHPLAVKNAQLAAALTSKFGGGSGSSLSSAQLVGALVQAGLLDAIRAARFLNGIGIH